MGVTGAAAFWVHQVHLFDEPKLQIIQVINHTTYNSGFFIVRFCKTQGAKLKPFFKTQGSKLKVFPKNSMYRRFFNQIFGKKIFFCGKFCLQNLKVVLKTATF